MRSQAEKGRVFRELHERPGLLLLPNPWDAGTARLLQSLGFEALATTSLGMANALGRVDGDNSVSRAELLENCRVNKGEKKNNDELAQKMAKLCDIYANDAFGTAHRAEATTHGIAKYAPIACAGPLLAAELDALGKALHAPARPLVAIVAGSKVSTKLTILEALADKVDQLIVGGGIANTFLLAAGKNIGKSLAEADLVEAAKKVMLKVKVPLPTDVVCAKEFSATATATVKSVDAVADDDVARQQDGVDDDAVVADDAVVGGVAVGHPVVAAADEGGSSRLRRAGDRHAFPEGVVVAHLHEGVGLAVEAQVLGVSAEHGEGVDEVPLAERGPAAKDAVGAQDAARADAHAGFDHGAGSDFHVVGQDGRGIHDG